MSQTQTFAERLSALRAQQKMGVRELGRAVGVTGMHISNLEKGKSAPSAELVLKLAEALEANADELLYLADQVSPEVVDVIHQNPLAIPNFLRSAKNLTPEQWELLQKQVEQMTEEKWAWQTWSWNFLRSPSTISRPERNSSSATMRITSVVQ